MNNDRLIHAGGRLARTRTMRIVNTRSLVRGKTLADYAVMGDAFASTLTASDYIGIVAACIDRGIGVEKIGHELTGVLGREIAGTAQQTYRLFESYAPDGGLWTEGGAQDDITFNHPALDAFYPGVKSDRSEGFKVF